VAAFPNGTFANIAHIDADDSYQAWMFQTMRDALGDETFGYIDHLYDQKAPQASGKQNGTILKQVISSVQEAFGSLLSPKKIIDTPNSVASTALNSTIIIPEMPLFGLISLLKETAEEYLGSAITNVTVSFPIFFGPLQVLLLDNALERASLFDPVCRINRHSPSSAAIAYRRAAYDRPKSSLDCIYGQFGIEDVITVEYTKVALTISKSTLYVGETSSWQQHGSYAIISRNMSDQDPDHSNSLEGAEFWKKARSCLRTLVLPGPGLLPGETFNRLVLTGTLAHDLDLLGAIRDCLGEMIPSENPQIVRVIRSLEDVTKANYRHLEFQRKAGLSCLLLDTSSGDIVRGYEPGLLDSVRQNENKIKIDPVFAAARGAALLSLESRFVPCQSECEGLWECQKSVLQFLRQGVQGV